MYTMIVAKVKYMQLMSWSLVLNTLRFLSFNRQYQYFTKQRVQRQSHRYGFIGYRRAHDTGPDPLFAETSKRTCAVAADVGSGFQDGFVVHSLFLRPLALCHCHKLPRDQWLRNKSSGANSWYRFRSHVSACSPKMPWLGSHMCSVHLSWTPVLVHWFVNSVTFGWQQLVGGPYSTDDSNRNIRT
jgi:hypothetical protein